jgi:predicted  nucleic acid-binding Zn-ribbon protein
MIDGTEGKAKLTAAWRAAVARMIEAGYTPADVHETLISVGMSGRRRWRHSSIIPVGVAIVSVSALLLFSGLVSTNSSAIWRTLLGSASEQQRDNTLLETRQALLLAHGEIEALKAEGSRALASAEAVRAAEAQGVEQQEALAREREEAERLKRDLADARSEIEALKAEGSRTLASAEAVRAAEAQGVEQQEALAREREEAERLKRDLADARTEIETLKADASRALANTDGVRATEAQGVEQQEALAREREEAERLKRDLADARSEIEALKADASRALANTDGVRAAEAQGVEQQEALAREREEAERLKRDLAADARNEIKALKAEGSRALASAEAAAEGQTNQNAGEPQGTTGHGANPDPASTASTLAPTTPEQVLLARANSLLKDGDISGARLLLERAVQTGSSRAAFQLAETHDPRQLSRWRAHGIRGDWATAQALYLRAHEGGIMQAKDRIAPIQ